ncbi:MAG: biopolymer transporter ExbD [Rhodothermales bacterium]|nr:biopolymer transporter ExbD [Rhodothermales bacterium]
MPQIKKKKRREVEIPTASMADIAFLLLIFFLVTTVIDVDTGIGMVLPPPLDENVDPPPVLERNMLKILVNEVGQLLMEDRPASTEQVKEEVKKHVLNMGADPNYSDSPTKALISIKNARETPYRSYIAVLDRTWMAYFEIWDGEARKLGYPDYKTYVDALGESRENEIRERFPAAISIAEPDAQ